MSMNHIYEQDNTHRLAIKCDKYVKPRGKQKRRVHCQVSSEQQPCRHDPQGVRKTGGGINKLVNIKCVCVWGGFYPGPAGLWTKP